MMENQKVQISQDVLYRYLQEHDFNVSLLGKRMGISNGLLTGCFRHDPNRHGKPLRFSTQNVERMNDALQVIVGELRGSLLSFGSDQTFTNQRGATYDPAVVDGFRRVGEFVKLKGFTFRVLGWNRAKYEGTVSVKSSPMYGRISRDDVERVNAELLSMVGVLGTYEVVINTDTNT